MGNVNIVCPHCQATGDLDEKYIGRKIKCQCGKSFVLDRTLPSDQLEVPSTNDISINASTPLAYSNNSQSINICKYCGAQSATYMRFCGVCGIAFSKTTPKIKDNTIESTSLAKFIIVEKPLNEEYHKLTRIIGGISLASFPLVIISSMIFVAISVYLFQDINFSLLIFSSVFSMFLLALGIYLGIVALKRARKANRPDGKISAIIGVALPGLFLLCKFVSYAYHALFN